MMIGVNGTGSASALDLIDPYHNKTKKYLSVLYIQPERIKITLGYKNKSGNQCKPKWYQVIY